VETFAGHIGYGGRKVLCKWSVLVISATLSVFYLVGVGSASPDVNHCTVSIHTCLGLFYHKEGYAVSQPGNTKANRAYNDKRIAKSRAVLCSKKDHALSGPWRLQASSR